MNLFYTIKQILEQSDHDELLITLEYYNLKIEQKTLLIFIDRHDTAILERILYKKKWEGGIK